MIKVGFRAHDLGSFESVETLAERVEKLASPSFLHLALKKAVPSAKAWQDWDEEYINSVRQTLNAHGVSIAIVGCYIQPTHPDENKRKMDIERFKKALSLNKAFGCKIIATETGTRNTDGGYSTETSNPEFLEMFYSSLSEMVDAAEKFGAYCTIEPVAHVHTISTYERVARMLEKFPSSSLKILFDPINLVPYEGIAEKDGVHLAHPSKEAMHAFYAPVLDLCQDRLVAIHCKDYKLDEKDGHKIGNIAALTGVFDWKGFAEEINKRGISVPWTLENLNPDTAAETKRIIESF